MKLRALVDWRIFSICLAASFLLAWAIHVVLEFNYWASWGIIMFAWIGLGILALFDDDEPKRASGDEKPKDSSNA